MDPPHVAELKQGDQLEPTYSSSVRIRDVALRIYQKRWTIGRSCERGSRISVLVARHDDDDDDRTFVRRGFVLPLCRDAVGLFYSPSRLGNPKWRNPRRPSIFVTAMHQCRLVPPSLPVGLTLKWLHVKSDLVGSEINHNRLSKYYEGDNLLSLWFPQHFSSTG